MTEHEPRSPVAIAATVVAGLAAVGSIPLDGEAEVSLLMVVAVITGLACFDAAMDRKRGPLWPWAMFSLAPIVKTVPTVIHELRADGGALVQRYDHAGSVLAGLCVLGGVVLLVKPAKVLGRTVAAFDVAVVGGSAMVAGVAGTSVAFLFERGFGSVAVARLVETSTWTIIGGTLAATAIVASHTRRPTGSLAGFLVFAGAVTGLLSIGVIGRDLDRGWWAVAFAGLTASALLNRRRLGMRAERDRRSNVAVAVAVVAGLVAAASAISARSDPLSRGPGWSVLGALALAMFLLAMVSRPLEDQVEDQVTDAAEVTDATGVTEVRGGTGATEEPGRLVAVDPRRAAQAQERAAQSLDEHHRVAREPSPSAATDAAAPRADEDALPDEDPLSDAGTVAAARDAAAVRNAPHPQRHSLAPVDQAHHFDPATGLLSAAGLQHALERAFDVERRAGHVTILLFMIRDLDRIERDHGRLASAAATRTVADRMRSLLVGGTGARFARSAYAVIFVGDRSDSAATIESMAQALLRLRAPVVEGPLRLEIDVVAGMAQCYEGESAAQFVQRANLGLARAVRASEPSLVAMP